MLPGLAVIFLALVLYGIWTTKRVNSLEARFEGLQANHQELLSRHRALAREVLHLGDLSRESDRQSRVDLIRDALGVPATAVLEASPTDRAINSGYHPTPR